MSRKKRERAKIKAEEGISLRRFFITYVLLMGAFFFIIGFTPLQRIIDLNGAYTKAVVLVTSKVLEVMGIRSTVTGTIISLQGLSLDVRFGCNGLEAVMIYTVAVIAFPSSWRERFKGILIGFLVIQVINILRILALAYTGIHLKGLFEYIHIYVAQGIMIALALGVFLIYLNLIRTQAKTDNKA